MSGTPTPLPDANPKTVSEPPALLERSREQEALLAAIEGLRGGGGVLAIEGPAGIGKSSLLGAAIGLARQRGLDVLGARGSELERGFPYGVVRQLLEPPLRDAGERLSLGERDDFGTLNDLYWLLAGLAERRPLLVCLDDAQWADVASLRFAGYLARRLDGVAALVCVTLRPARSEPELAALLAEAGRSAGVLRPAPLSPAGAAKLAQDLLGGEPEERFLAACHEATGGNPMLLRELCRGLSESGVEPTAARVGEVRRIGGDALAASVRLRLSQLPAAGGGLARAAAVLGDGAELDDAAALAGLTQEDALDALDALAGQDVLRRGPGLEFAHPLLREAVIAGIGAGEAARAHAEAARLLAARGASAQRVAEQILRAPPTGEPGRVETLREVASGALAAGEGRAAVAYLRRALEEPPATVDRVAVLMALARAEALVDGPAAVEHATQALELIEEPRARAAAAATLASLLPAIDPDRSIEVGRAALRELGDSDPELQRRLEAIVLTGELLAEPGRRGGEPIGREALAAADGDEGPSERMLACTVGFREARANLPAAEVVPLVRRAFRGEWTRHAEAAGAQYVFGMLVLIAADDDDVLGLCDEWEVAGRRLGRLGAYSGAKMFRAHALVARGELEEAATEAADALEAMETYRPGGAAVAYAAAALADAQIGMGELEGAGATLGRAGDALGAPSTVNLHSLWLSRAQLRREAGDPAGALEELLDLGRRFERIGGRNPALLPWRSEAALLASELGDAERARGLAEEEVALAREWGAPRALGRAIAAAGTVGGDPALLREAVAVLEASGARLELARAQLRLGMGISPHSPSEAREPLGRALELAAACGAAPLERCAREELLATGARPRRRAVSGPGALTRRERQVAEIALGGRSNREIAQELYLTTRTVETHLTRVYRKLGIGSRAQLEEVLASPTAARLSSTRSRRS